MGKIIEHLNWRYATKKFDSSKKLSKDKIDIIKEAFNLTATSFGLQTISLVIVSNDDLKASLVPHAYYQNQVSEASHLLVICIQDDISDSDVNLYFNSVKNIRNTPETILNPFRKNLLKTMQGKSVENRQLWSKNQAYIALGNLMTVCAVEGIDSCPMEGFIPEKYDEVLELNKKGLKSVLLLPIGYRADDDMFATLKKVRKPLNETIIEIK
ncbi:NAD(P)H-dependent oxidoreductase [Yeosuana marina]|uniref:NAD(P)H-dependent oxidoreductase n=1 Tax=Yeosuana marina TaxID=1565536 RepID=UPI0030ED659F|tara:strand:- start:2288 stop:2923 length:636 start_codon:yes stop_codon:yes gene_type:complete